MIFALRAIMVSLAFFALVYSFLSLLLVLIWRGPRSLRAACDPVCNISGGFSLPDSPVISSVRRTLAG
jgi:hypothetical protein